MLRFTVREEVPVAGLIPDFAGCGHGVEDDAFFDLHDVGLDWLAA